MAASLSRRDFLSLAAASATALTAGCATGRARFGGIIDTHTHFYDPTRPEGVPWPPPGEVVLHRPVYPEEYRRLAEPLGVTGTVVVEASPWVEDNQWVLDLAAREPFIVGFVGNLKPGTPDFAGHLKRFAANRLFRGIRVGADSVRAATADGLVRRDLQRLAEHDLSLDLLIPPQQLSAVAQLGRELPELRLVVDHCANVPVGLMPPADWKAGLQACRDVPNVNMKVSGLVEGTGRRGGLAPTEPARYQAVLKAVWEAFGEDRVIYGSNWPVSGLFADYATVQGIVEGFFTEKGTRAATKYFHRNAARVYKFVRR